MTHKPHIVGLILAGGRSRRMQGQDKALLAVQGETLLAHVIRRLRPQVDALALSSNARTRYLCRVWSAGDPRSPARLSRATGRHSCRTYAISRGLPRDRRGRLAVSAARSGDAAAFRTGIESPVPMRAMLSATHSPCCGVRAWQRAWKIICNSGGRNLKDYLAVHGQPVRFDRPQDRGLFCNINTPEDLARAERIRSCCNSLQPQMNAGIGWVKPIIHRYW